MPASCWCVPRKIEGGAQGLASLPSMWETGLSSGLLLLDLAPVTAEIWGVNQQMEDVSLSLSALHIQGNKLPDNLSYVTASFLIPKGFLFPAEVKSSVLTLARDHLQSWPPALPPFSLSSSSPPVLHAGPQAHSHRCLAQHLSHRSLLPVWSQGFFPAIKVLLSEKHRHNFWPDFNQCWTL